MDQFLEHLFFSLIVECILNNFLAFLLGQIFILDDEMVQVRWQPINIIMALFLHQSLMILSLYAVHPSLPI